MTPPSVSVSTRPTPIRCLASHFGIRNMVHCCTETILRDLNAFTIAWNFITGSWQACAAEAMSAQLTPLSADGAMYAMPRLKQMQYKTVLHVCRFTTRRLPDLSTCAFLSACGQRFWRQRCWPRCSWRLPRRPLLKQKVSLLNKIRFYRCLFVKKRPSAFGEGACQASLQPPS